MNLFYEIKKAVENIEVTKVVDTTLNIAKGVVDVTCKTVHCMCQAISDAVKQAK